jgi:hypothetical protein
MNNQTLLKSLAAAGFFTAVFVGFTTVQADLHRLGIAVGYLAAVAIFGLAAFDGYRRRSV